jgi:hypothetical protein
MRAHRESPRSRGAGLVLSALLVGVLAIGGLGLAGKLLGFFPGTTVTKDRSAPVVLTDLRDLARYRAATGDFEQLVDVEQDVRWAPSFLAGERTLLVAVGSVDAEVDFSDLGPQHVVVSPDGERAEIHLPPAELTDPRLDLERTHVASRQRGLANRVSQALTTNTGDDGDLLRLAEARISEAAGTTGLADRAEDNTRAMLTQLLTGLGFSEVVVSFDVQPPQ